MRTTILLVFVCSGGAIAQQGYDNGFLLTASLDTVPGVIRFSRRSSVPEPCLFRSAKKAETKEVHPGSVHGFCTADGAYFYSRTLGNGAEVFLEVLVKGYMNLFKFGGIYYIEKADSAFFELSHELEVSTADGRRLAQRSNNYSRMLALMMSDCEKSAKEAANTSLRDKALVRIVVNYNNCKGSSSQLFRVSNRRRQPRDPVSRR